MSHVRRMACPGPINRRQWLQIGGLSLGALATGAGPTPRTLSAATSRGADDDFAVILFWANGGPSHLETFDLKPDAPAEYRGPFQPIATNVPGLEICEHLPKLATMADKFAIVRSLRHERNQHSGGTHRFLTGYPSRASDLAQSEYPELGSIVAERFSQRMNDAPTFVANTKFYGGGPGYLGPAYAAYMPHPDPISASGANQYDPIPIYSRPESGDDLAISSDGVAALSRRLDVLQQLDLLPRRLDDSGTMAAIDGFQRQAALMLSSPRTRAAFDLAREPDAVRERYGRTHWGDSLLTCRRLVEAGVRIVQCQAEYRLPADVGRTSNWDDHAVNADIFRAYREKLPHLDHSISALVEDLYDRGLDRRVLFIFCGEFGRTPRIGDPLHTGRPGRDHWPSAMSVFLAGGGLRMGQVIGATSSKGEEPIERRMDSNCLLATIYHRFGIDVRHLYHDRAGRPFPILPAGEPIAELL